MQPPSGPTSAPLLQREYEMTKVRNDGFNSKTFFRAVRLVPHFRPLLVEVGLLIYFTSRNLKLKTRTLKTA